jgi:hypothetical protein
VLALSFPVDERGIQPFPADHDFRAFRDIHDGAHWRYQGDPRNARRGMSVGLTFGVVPADDGHRTDPKDHGALHFDAAFDLDDRAAQAFLLATVRAARAEPFVLPWVDADLQRYSALVLETPPRCAGEDSLAELALASDGRQNTAWVSNACGKPGVAGEEVSLLVTLVGDGHTTKGQQQRADCRRNTLNCLLLSPPVAFSAELTWAEGLAPRAFVVEASPTWNAADFRLVANRSGLARGRRAADVVDLGGALTTFLRVRFLPPADGPAALAQLALVLDSPTLPDLLDAFSRALPAGAPCAGGLPLPAGGNDSLVACIGRLARMRTDRTTGNVVSPH